MLLKARPVFDSSRLAPAREPKNPGGEAGRRWSQAAKRHHPRLCGKIVMTAGRAITQAAPAEQPQVFHRKGW
jgi:hypothetical protein